MSGLFSRVVDWGVSMSRVSQRLGGLSTRARPDVTTRLEPPRMLRRLLVIGAVGPAAALRASQVQLAAHNNAMLRHTAFQTQRMLMVEAGENKKGTCKWFDPVKGYGFITVEGEEVDVFVHQSDIYAPGFRSLMEGEQLEFEIMVDPKSQKFKAIKVTGPDGGYVQGQPKRPMDDDMY